MEFSRPPRKTTIELEVNTSDPVATKRHLDIIAQTLQPNELKMLSMAVQKPMLKNKALNALKLFM